MGKRTVHQVDAKAQLVVMATRNRAAVLAAIDPQSGDRTVEGFSRADMGLDPEAAAAAQSKSSGSEVKRKAKETSGLCEEADVFVAPVLVSEDGQVSLARARHHWLPQAHQFSDLAHHSI